MAKKVGLLRSYYICFLNRYRHKEFEYFELISMLSVEIVCVQRFFYLVFIEYIITNVVETSKSQITDLHSYKIKRIALVFYHDNNNVLLLTAAVSLTGNWLGCDTVPLA